MSLLHTNTEITLRIEPVTGARFDFIPSLPSRLSLGLSHKQSPSSRSRYEISFVGCWQVPHVGSATCVSLSLSHTCVCVCCVRMCVRESVKGRKEWVITHTHTWIYRSVIPPRCTASHKVASSRESKAASNIFISTSLLHRPTYTYSIYGRAHTYTHAHW